MWFRDAIIYHILIDRFAGYDLQIDWQKPVFMGGNLQGLAGKIDYLSDLGINTIWLSPVNQTTAYHGYHITDFRSVDERFGTEDDLRLLIDMAHEKNIRIVLDFVPNHCSWKHPLFQNALADRRNPYRKWFYFNPFTNTYLCFLHHRDLPKLNLDYPAARDHLIEAAKHWLSLGIDGFRLDHAVGPSHRFWKTFRQEVRSVNPEAVLIGEAWLEGVTLDMLGTIRIRHKYLRWLTRFRTSDIQRDYIGEFDGALDFYFRQCITGNIAWKDNPESFTETLTQAMLRQYRKFPSDYYLPSFIDNHDMNRFLFEAGQNREKLRIALRLQFSLPQPPILYYGTETGLSHEEPVSWDVPHSDVQARKPMPWQNLDREMIDFCQELIRKRKFHPPPFT